MINDDEVNPIMHKILCWMHLYTGITMFYNSLNPTQFYHDTYWINLICLLIILLYQIMTKGYYDYDKEEKE